MAISTARLHEGPLNIRAKNRYRENGAAPEPRHHRRQGDGTPPPATSDGSAETSDVALTRIAPDIDASSPVPHRTGESCDYGAVAAGLLRTTGEGST